MANFGDIGSGVSIGAGQSVRRNAGDTAFEAFTPSAGAGVPDGDYGDISVSGSGATWTVDNGAITLAKQADMATASVVYRKTAGTGAPEVQTLATLKTDLAFTKSDVGLGSVVNADTTTTANITDSTNKRFVTDAQQTVIGNTSGTNTGDQTSIVGITGTIAQFNTACTDADFATLAGTESLTNKKLGSLTSNGLVKTTSSDGTLATATPITDYLPGYTVVATLASDQATGANTTPVTLTDLVFTYEANSKYLIECMALVQPTAATTGCGFQFDLSSAVTSIWVQFFHQLANTGTLSGGHSIADDASVGVSSGMPGTSTYPVKVSGLLITTSNTGTAQLRFRSETTAVTTCKAGTTLIVRKIA